MNRERKPQVGDLAVVRSASTGDSPWVCELYISQNPVLIIENGIDTSIVAIVHEERKKFINRCKLEVISEGR